MSKDTNRPEPDLLSRLQHTVLLRKRATEVKSSIRDASGTHASDLLLKNRVYPVLLGTILLITLIIFFPLLPSIFMGITVALTLYPLYFRVVRFFQLGQRSERVKTIFSIVFTSAVALAIMVALAIPVIVLIGSLDKIQRLGENMGNIQANADATLAQFGIVIPWEEYQAVAVDRAKAMATGLLGESFWLLLNFFTFGVVLYLCLRYGAELFRNVLELMPEKTRAVVQRFSIATKRICYAIYVVHFATVFATCLIAIPMFVWMLPEWAGATHYGEDWLFWCIVLSIFQLLPMVGPSFLIVSMAAFEGLANNNWGAVAILMTYGYAGICLSPDWILRPWLMSKQADVHALILWLGFFGGIALMGIPGFVFGPLLLVLVIESVKITLELYENPLEKAVKKTLGKDLFGKSPLMPSDTPTVELKAVKPDKPPGDAAAETEPPAPRPEDDAPGASQGPSTEPKDGDDVSLGQSND